jgi:hypothetical protein
VRHFIVHMRRAANGSARPLNCGVMRLSSVIRWILVVPSAVVAWYIAFVVALVLGAPVPCMDSDGPQSRLCDAAWFPAEAVERGVVFFGVGLSATLVVVVSAAVAPSNRSAVAWLAAGAGTVVASIFGYRVEAFAEAAVAIASGLIVATLVSRATTGSRGAKVTRIDVVPNA